MIHWTLEKKGHSKGLRKVFFRWGWGDIFDLSSVPGQRVRSQYTVQSGTWGRGGFTGKYRSRDLHLSLAMLGNSGFRIVTCI